MLRLAWLVVTLFLGGCLGPDDLALDGVSEACPAMETKRTADPSLNSTRRQSDVHPTMSNPNCTVCHAIIDPT